MPRFLAMYIGTATTAQKTAWDAMPDAEREALEQEGMAAWGQWMNTQQAAIADTGGPLGSTKRVSSAGIEDTSNQLVGYVIIEASSHDEAAEMFLEHPHFTVFPGDSVEIMECIAIPGIDT